MTLYMHALGSKILKTMHFSSIFLLNMDCEDLQWIISIQKTVSVISGKYQKLE